MQKRQLGKSDLQVAPWALGGNVFGWTIDEQTSFNVLDAFVSHGFNMIDTADVYCRWATNVGGESETVIGNWLAKTSNRDKIVLATKVGMDMGNGNVGLSKKHILKSVEDSLKRLQTDYIDLYQSHKDDLDTPQDETLAAHDELAKSGKVRFIGASNFSGERLTSALGISEGKGYARYECLQPNYNLYNREDFETNLEGVCLENNVGVIPYFALASGFLTGKYRTEADFSKSVRGGSMGKYLNDRGLRILKALDEVAETHKATQAQVALAWLMARPSITAPIASATSVAQVDDIAKAAHLRLNTSDIDLLNAASAY